MAIGGIHTTTSWNDLIKQVKKEFDLWGIQADLPYKGDSERAQKVTIYYTKNGKTSPLECSEFSDAYNGPECNLCALREVIRALRLMDQRGIGHIMAEAAQNLLALGEGIQSTDPHYLLNVRPEAPKTVKEHAYHWALKEYHPDTPDTGDREKFDRVREAGEILKLH